MKVKELFIGMPVYIDPRCYTTKRRYGLTKEMIKLTGTVQKIKHISGNCIKIKEFNWAPEDLSHPIEKTKSIKPVLFNPKELVL